MQNKLKMKHIAKAYSVALATLVPSSAVWSVTHHCPVSASVCGLLILALALDQFRLVLDKKAGNDEKISAMETRVALLNEAVSQINIKEFIARSDEVRVCLNSMKTHNPYRRTLG